MKKILNLLHLISINNYENSMEKNHWRFRVFLYFSVLLFYCTSNCFPGFKSPYSCITRQE